MFFFFFSFIFDRNFLGKNFFSSVRARRENFFSSFIFDRNFRKKGNFFFVSIFDFGNFEKKEISLLSISNFGRKQRERNFFFFGMKILNLPFKRDLIL